MAATAEKTVIVPKLGNLTLLRASDVGQAWGLNLLIYGTAGSGKTTLASSAQDSPHGRDVLYIDLEGGTLSISDRQDIFIYRPKGWDDLPKVFSELHGGKHDFKTIVIDSLTEVYAFALSSVLTNLGIDTPDQRAYGMANRLILRLVRNFRGLTYSHQINTIFTALEKQVQNKATNAFSTGPAFTPESKMNIEAAVDSIGYLTWNPKTGKRILHLEGDGNFTAKVRQPKTNKKIPPRIEDPSLVTILEALKGGGGSG